MIAYQDSFIIATASTADLPRPWLDEHNIPFIPYCYMLGDRVVEDDCREESRSAVYAGMRAGDTPKTSMINRYVYEEFFRGLMAGGKDVVFLDMSEKMSSSYLNSQDAAAAVQEEFPGQRLIVMDTRCISGGLGMLVVEMVRRAEAGASFDEVLAWGEENKLRIAHRFTVDDLNWLKAGGRVSNAAALIGTMLSIKPVLYVPDGGTLDVVSKQRGRKAACKCIRDGVLHDMEGVDTNGAEVHILHADCLADAQWLEAELRAAHPELGEITITQLGVIIGAHCGPGLLTVFYLCNGRQPE